MELRAEAEGSLSERLIEEGRVGRLGFPYVEQIKSIRNHLLDHS